MNSSFQPSNEFRCYVSFREGWFFLFESNSRHLNIWWGVWTIDESYSKNLLNLVDAVGMARYLQGGPLLVISWLITPFIGVYNTSYPFIFGHLYSIYNDRRGLPCRACYHLAWVPWWKWGWSLEDFRSATRTLATGGCQFSNDLHPSKNKKMPSRAREHVQFQWVKDTSSVSDILICIYNTYLTRIV